MSEEWPFTPEVKTGGWQVYAIEHPDNRQTLYVLDESFHREPSSDETAANVNLIAAAPRMYRAVKELTEHRHSAFAEGEICGPAIRAREVIDWIDQR
jgi:hypothetical protein